MFYEPCCTKADVIWQPDHQMFECPMCGAQYDDEEYNLLPEPDDLFNQSLNTDLRKPSASQAGQFCVGWKVWVKWPCVSREKCLQYMRLLGYAMVRGLVPARHLPARASQWQAGRSRSGEAGGNDDKGEESGL